MRRLAISLLTSALFVLTPALVQHSTAQTAPPRTAPASKTTPATAAKPAEAPKAALVDINRASKQELDALPGIGAARSQAIIAGRPYKRKDDLAARKIIPQNIYDGIKDRIIAHQM